jgi:acyl carrier protein
MSSIAADVRSFVVANYLLGREDGFSNDASFMDEGIIDSTGILELVSHLEEAYGIVIPEDELIPDNLDSVNRIAKYLATKLGDRSADSAEARAEELNSVL